MKLERLQARLDKWYARLDRRLGGRLSLLVRTALAFDQDDGPLMARSLAYYALFAVFPAILALIVVASAVLESAEVQESVMALVVQYMPIAQDVVVANIEQLLKARETVGLIALVGLIWSASGVFSAVFRSVNRAWGIPKSRLVLSEKLYGLAMMFVVGTFFLLTLSIGPVVNLARAWRIPVLGWQPAAPLAVQAGADRLVGWLSALVPPLLSVGAFILMYRTMPRARVRWRDVWLGGLIAGLVWEAGKQLFTWYVGSFAEYNVVYGSVATIIVFLLWSYLSAQIFLLGAEFTAEYSRWRRAGRPLETRPLRAWLADWSPARESEENT
ncbi:MAG: YihY/virulence factor BrkB family protein [Anaerolineae bacterium]|jgi:membrane protein